MTPDQFLEMARVLPEPLVLLSSQGEILAANRAVSQLLACSSKDLPDTSLWAWTAEPADKILHYLQACARSRQLVVGSLTFCPQDSEPLICRTEGAVVQPTTPTSPALILLRLEKRAIASGDFVLLNQKINELTQEIHQRQHAEAELMRNNQELEQAIHQLKSTQLKLVQTEKMSSLGQLVAGIAHEINNPVNFIHGNLTYATQYVQDLLNLVQAYEEAYPQPTASVQELIEEIDLPFVETDLKKLLQSMQLGTNRIREIVKSLRTFSRLDEAEVKAVDIHDGLESTLVILQSRLKAKPERPEIQVVREYSTLSLVDCYPGQLNQVFMNILSNAIDALEEVDQQRSLDEIYAAPSMIYISTDPFDNDHITIRIRDNGPGIPEQVRDRIFEPFFTTKPVGKGTGLGLSISYQVITETHRGQLYCQLAAGGGTEFIITIPIHQPVANR